MPEPYFSDDMVAVHVGDCRKVLPLALLDALVDAVVCDPPYELGFMGRGWDASGVAFDPVTWRECLRVAKPGAHLLAFGGTRTWHRVAVAIEDAGWEIRDTIMWITGQGFPKSLDVSRAIDKAAGAERPVVGVRRGAGIGSTHSFAQDAWTDAHRGPQKLVRTAPATENAARWEGWGTALKPGWEPIILARKPLAGTVAQNVQTYGTGALNIGATRVEPTGESRPRIAEASQGRRYTERGGTDFAPLPGVRGGAPEGRWPVNVVFTHHAACVEDGPCQPDCPVAELDRQSGTRPSGGAPDGVDSNTGLRGNTFARQRTPRAASSGGASRYFPVFRYEAKAPASERPKLDDGTAHSTVKPLELMKFLVRLVTPPGGTVLDPFAGSGTTGEACVLEGFQAVLIELERPHAELIKRRLSKPLQPSLDLFAPTHETETRYDGA